MLNEIKSKYMLEYLFTYIKKDLLYKIVKYNKKLQTKINLSLKDYKMFSKIMIELHMSKYIFDTELFINFEQQYRPYYHIYFNDKKVEENFPINLNMSNFESLKYFIRSKITNKKKEIIQGYFFKKNNVKTIKIVIDDKVKSLKGLFKNCRCYKEINFINFNRKNIEDMSEMFYGCTSLIKFNLTNFRSDNVTNMSDMFAHSGIRNLKLNNLNTSNVTNMNYMFSDCDHLEILDLSGFDTINVTRMSNMFCECTRLEKLNITDFDTSKVIDMYKMFSGCFALKNLDLSNFNTSNVQDMGKMFDGCCLIEELNLENFDTKNVNNMNNMFNGCLQLKYLNINNFNISKETDIEGIFNGCLKLNIDDLLKNLKRK